MGSNDTQGARPPLRGDAGVTIRDIAKALNISHTTVSRALADSPKISDETKSRVRAVVAQMGYVPSASARMMRGRPSSLVGLIIPDVQNDFYATVAKIVADSLAAHSMQLLLSVTERHGAIALILFFDEQKQVTAVAQFVGLLAGFAGTASSGEGLRRG